MTTRAIPGWCAVLMWVGCQSDPVIVASNCDEHGGCEVTPTTLKIDQVDILLVLDNSGSIGEEAKRVQAELPRLLEALTRGEDGDASFPPATSVHVAVTTTEMDIDEPDMPHCEVGEREGVFARPGDVGLTCEVSYPGFLDYDGRPAPVSTVTSVGCLPLVLPEKGSPAAGCRFEQPLEAALKSLWPGTRPGVTFPSGSGNGLDENAGFLREDSLLVVIVVTDEDDCSAADLSMFDQPQSTASEAGTSRPPTTDLNLVCYRQKDKLHPVQRYVDGLKAVRPNNDNVIFGLIGGIPPELVREENRAHYDLTDEADVQRYYDDILAFEGMREVPILADDPAAKLAPSCARLEGRGPYTEATPPRRLIEVAKGFGVHSVIGSLCSEDYGATTGRLIRAISGRLNTTDSN